MSADRANASRRELVAAGMDDAKIMRVVGLAASVPFQRDDPLHPTNRRISILVMNKQTEEQVSSGGINRAPGDTGDGRAVESGGPGTASAVPATSGK